MKTKNLVLLAVSILAQTAISSPAFADGEIRGSGILDTKIEDLKDLESLQNQKIMVLKNSTVLTLTGRKTLSVNEASCQISSPVLTRIKNDLEEEFKTIASKYGSKSGGLTQAQYKEMAATEEGQAYWIKTEQRDRTVLLKKDATYEVVSATGNISRSSTFKFMESLKVAPDYSRAQPLAQTSLILKGEEGVVVINCSARGENFGEAKVAVVKIKSFLNTIFSK